MMEELIPFNAEFSYNLQTILNDDDMKQAGLYSEIPLLDRYKSKTVFDYSDE